MKEMGKQATTKPSKVWTIMPSSDLQRRVYHAKGEKQKSVPDTLSDRDFLLELIELGLKKFEN